jgi:hypothetical protein
MSVSYSGFPLTQCTIICAFVYTRYPFCGKNGMRHDRAYLEILRAKIRETVGQLLACGIAPAESLLFVQSHVPAHAELAWVLNCVTPVGWSA